MQRIRWPKNYSIFSGSDSDSDGQPAQRRGRGPQLRLDLPGEGPSMGGVASKPVIGVYLFCAGDQVDLSVLKTPPAGSKPARKPEIGTASVLPSDAVFEVSPLPISNMIGVPLLMRRLQSKPSPTSPHFDNPLASQLQFDPENPAFDVARGLGTVLVVRADREPLQKELIDRICSFHAKLLNMAQQRGPGSMSEVLKTWATPQKFVEFCMESYPNPGMSKTGVANSVHELLGTSWFEVQPPIVTN